MFGCDSVVTIGFTLLEETSSSTLASACDGYVWNDSLYTTSGTYDWQGTNVEGCDSLATLELTVYDSWSVTDDAQESCAPLVWNDVLLSSSGTYTYEGSTVFGCDSVVTIGFTLLETEQVVVTAQGCDSVFVESQWLSEVALYDFEYQDDNGCVGLVTYDVQLDYSSESWTTLQSCDSLLWNDLLLQESAVYSFSTVNAAGCDSVAYVEFTLAELSGAELDLPEFVCLGDEVNAGLGDWQPEDQTVVYWSFEGGDTSDVYNVQIPSLVPGTFEVTVILDAAFCNEQLQGSYEVLDLPENHLEDPLLFHPTCAGFSDGAIQVLHSGDLDLTYVWNPNSLSGNVGTQLEAGEYEVTVSNNGYCPHVLELQLLEPEPLVLEVLIELGTPCGSNEGQLEIDIQGGTSPYDIVWSNGGTTPAIGQLAAGQYEVVVEDEQGCTASDAFVVECDAVLDLLPFEFVTHDGDGSNDTWVIDNAEHHSDLSIRVYNRWGSLVFEHEGPYLNSWTGTDLRGRPLPSATYFWLIEAPAVGAQQRGFLELQRR